MTQSQAITGPWGVSAFGAASVDAAPDLARLKLVIKESRPTPAQAFEVTRAGVNRVRDAIRAHGVPDKAVSASRLTLLTAWSFRNNVREPAGYECGVAFVVELRDLDVLETLLIDVVEAGINQVDGVDFDVSTKKELRAQARKGAVGAAYEKASLYAEASGARLGPVIHIEDVDAEQTQMQMRSGYRGHSVTAFSGDGEGDLMPGRVSVWAGVVLGFALSGGAE